MSDTTPDLDEGDTVTLTIDLGGDQATNEVTVTDVGYSGETADVETASGKTYLLNMSDLGIGDGRVATLQQHGREVAPVVDMEV